MYVVVDDRAEINDVGTVKIVIGMGRERHVIVTVYDVVVQLIDNGTVVQSRTYPHDNLMFDHDGRRLQSPEGVFEVAPWEP